MIVVGTVGYWSSVEGFATPSEWGVLTTKLMSSSGIGALGSHPVEILVDVSQDEQLKPLPRP